MFLCRPYRGDRATRLYATASNRVSLHDMRRSVISVPALIGWLSTSGSINYEVYPWEAFYYEQG